MNKIDIKPTKLHKLLISFFFTLAFLSFLFDINDLITENIINKNLITEQVNGITDIYITDSTNLEIDWFVEYKHSKDFDFKDISYMDKFIHNMMEVELRNWAKDTTSNIFNTDSILYEKNKVKIKLLIKK